MKVFERRYFLRSSSYSLSLFQLASFLTKSTFLILFPSFSWLDFSPSRWLLFSSPLSIGLISHKIDVSYSFPLSLTFFFFMCVSRLKNKQILTFCPQKKYSRGKWKVFYLMVKIYKWLKILLKWLKLFSKGYKKPRFLTRLTSTVFFQSTSLPMPALLMRRLGEPSFSSQELHAAVTANNCISITHTLRLKP